MFHKKINECFPSWTNKVNENWKPPNVFCVAHPDCLKGLEKKLLHICWWEKLRKHHPCPDVAVGRYLPASLIWLSSSLEDWSKAQSLEYGKFQLRPHVQLLFQLGPSSPQGSVVLQRSWCCIPLLTSSPSLTHYPAPFPHILVHSSIAHSSLQAATAPSWLHSQALL